MVIIIFDETSNNKLYLCYKYVILYLFLSWLVWISVFKYIIYIQRSLIYKTVNIYYNQYLQSRGQSYWLYAINLIK